MLELHDSPEVTEAESKTSLQVRKIDDWATLERLSPTWNLLVEKSSSNNFFLTWEWLSCWWKAYGGGKELFVLACSSDGGEIVGIAPLYRSHTSGALGIRSLHLIGDGSDDADNFDLIIHAGRERVCLTAILVWLSDNAAEWELLELNSVPSESSAVEELRLQMRELGWQDDSTFSPRCVVQLAGSWNEYLEKISKRTLSDWKRKMKRVEEKFAINFEHCETEGAVEAGLSALFDLHQKNWQARGKEGKFDLAERRTLYHSLATEAFQRGWLDLWLLKLDGVPVAAQFSIAYDNNSYALQLGFDPAFSGFGVGTLVQIYLVQALIRHGCRSHDFLGGQDAYKLQFGAERKQYLHVRCAPPRTRVALLLAAEKRASRSKEWLRERLPAGSWEILKRVKRAVRKQSGKPL